MGNGQRQSEWFGRGAVAIAPLLRLFSCVAGLGLGCPGAGAESLELVIRHAADGREAQLGSLRHETSAGERYSITRASYLLGGFELGSAEGGWIRPPEEAAWFDVEQGRNRARLEAPPGVYNQFRFVVGLEAELNHADPASFPEGHPLNPSLNHLHWSWQGGYIFMALEGNWRNGGGLDGWSYHLAGTGNQVAVTLDCELDLNGPARIELELELTSMLVGARPISFATDGTSTHSRERDPLVAALRENVTGAFRLVGISRVENEKAGESGPGDLDLPTEYTPYPFRMGASFPPPSLPKDNPLIAERVALGKRLFEESLLSRNNRLACASCHEERRAFTDGKPTSAGVERRNGTRNAMPLHNLAWRQSFFWDGRARTLREQALMPIQDHLEMDESITNVVRKLVEAGYEPAFAKAFRSETITPERMGKAIEQYLLGLTSHNSKFDKAARGEEKMTEQELRGQALFMTEYDPRRGARGADCFHCHGGALFQSQHFANNGLEFPPRDLGRGAVTGRKEDEGKFSTPSLRNVALTAPYMHDGRFETLAEVVGHYNKGVRRGGTLDPNLAKHPDGGLGLSQEDQDALVAFLHTLTDSQFIKGSEGD